MRYGAKALVGLVLLSAAVCGAGGGELSRSFELRYFMNDSAANGETDFRGETTVLNTEQRVEFLGRYAGYARRFFDDPGLDTEVVTDEEVAEFLARLKPQPRPVVRRRIVPENWKWMGYRKGQHGQEVETVGAWQSLAVSRTNSYQTKGSL